MEGYALTPQTAEKLGEVLRSSPGGTAPTAKGFTGQNLKYVLITSGTASPWTATVQEWDAVNSAWISYDTAAKVLSSSGQVLSVGVRYLACQTGTDSSNNSQWVAYDATNDRVYLCEVTIAASTHTVKRKTYNTGSLSIVDYSPTTTYTNCRSTVIGTNTSEAQIPAGALVWLNPIPDVNGYYWITPACFASDATPGFVSGYAQSFTGDKTFKGKLLVNQPGSANNAFIFEPTINAVFRFTNANTGIDHFIITDGSANELFRLSWNPGGPYPMLISQGYAQFNVQVSSALGTFTKVLASTVEVPNGSWVGTVPTGTVMAWDYAVQETSSTVSTGTTNYGFFNFRKGILCGMHPSIAKGDLMYADPGAFAGDTIRLPIGSTGNVLTVSGGVPVWAAPASGTISGSTPTSITGIFCGDGSVVNGRTLASGGAGITITNGTGASANPTVSLADDVAAVEALTTTGLGVRTGTSTWTTRTITAPAAGITVADGGGVAGNPTLALANDLSAVEGISGTGIACRTATDTWTTRTITSADSSVTITNAGGVGGNIDLSVSGSTSGKPCGLRLTGSSTDAWAETASFSTLYLLPAESGDVALYTSSAWKMYTTSSVSISLSSTGANTNYDVFLYDNSGTLTLELTAWSTNTARATALALQDGVYVKSGSTDKRYMGTLRTGTAGTSYDNFGNGRFLWNMYHRCLRHLYTTDSTNSWTYTTATFRQARASSSNMVSYVQGLATDNLFCRVRAIVGTTLSSANVASGIGVDNATNVAIVHGTQLVNTSVWVSTAEWAGSPGIGYHELWWLEQSGASGTTTWYGDAGNATQYFSGIIAEGMF